uniref:Uncharacterized protein n=1 Tax=Cucumis sativus TaxID=3659 RepID=A0A0A0L292_CUCSA
MREIEKASDYSSGWVFKPVRYNHKLDLSDNELTWKPSPPYRRTRCLRNGEPSPVDVI